MHEIAPFFFNKFPDNPSLAPSELYSAAPVETTWLSAYAFGVYRQALYSAAPSSHFPTHVNDFLGNISRIVNDIYSFCMTMYIVLVSLNPPPNNPWFLRTAQADTDS